MADINIYGKLVNQMEDGRLADTTQIYDPNLQKFQSEINAAEATAVAAAVVSGDYNTTTHAIRLYNSAGTVVSTIDATPFIKDGMVSSVGVGNGYLVITFNTDAGKQPITIPLTDIFNPNLYYTKQEVDAMIDGMQSLIYAAL